jgi:hypothetical protein
MSKFLQFLICILFITEFNSQNINVSGKKIFDGEPFLTIDPVNQQHLVVAWMGVELGQKITINSSVSEDGGLTWSSPIWQPHQVADNSSADVSMGFDNNDNLFMAYIDYDNVNFLNGGIYVRKSVDGGYTWGPSVEAISIADCPNKLCIDRPWMVVDGTGGLNDGVIYITSMNADQPSSIKPPYNPYLSVSVDGGNTFLTPRFLDTLNFLSGSTITQPMASPVVTSDGEFIAIYPSYEPTAQGPFAHLCRGRSITSGVDLFHTDAYSWTGNTISDPYVKRGALLKSDPSDPNHLAYFFLSQLSSETDIYFMESFDRGQTWSAKTRVNQDPLGNGKLQDLVWADFDLDGDLVICWRDRRSAAGTGYSQNTEIYGVVRWHGNSSFESDFTISDQSVPHQSILEGSGNDFMSVRLLNDTLYAVWGDVRTGILSVYLNKMSLHSGTQSISTIYSDLKGVLIYPNPTDHEIHFKNDVLAEEFTVTSIDGKILLKGGNVFVIDVKSLSRGSYDLELKVKGVVYRTSFLKE